MIHDIDIVAIPRFGISQSDDLFADAVEMNQLDIALADLSHTGKVRINKHGEKYLCLSLPSVDIPIDLYTATEKTWSTLLLIRTGSKKHNIFLCERARQLGMQLKADGSGLLRDDQRIASDSEESIFSALGINYVPPERREETGKGIWRGY